MQVTNSGEVKTVDTLGHAVANFLKKKKQKIADLAKKVVAKHKETLQKLIGIIERERKEIDKQNEIHVACRRFYIVCNMKLQKKISDLNERLMEKENELQEQKEKFEKAVEALKAITIFAGTQVTTLRQEILQKQIEAEKLQEGITFSDRSNSSNPGTTYHIFYLIFYPRSIWGSTSLKCLRSLASNKIIVMQSISSVRCFS